MQGSWLQYWQAFGQSEGWLWLQQCPVALGSCNQKDQNKNHPCLGKRPERFESVVGVHDWVDHVVHHHEPSNIGSEVAEAVEDRYEDTEVVIPANFKAANFKAHWKWKCLIRNMYNNQNRDRHIRVCCCNHQWRKMSFCFLRTMKAVSPSSTSLDQVNNQVQKADTWIFWDKRADTWIFWDKRGSRFKCEMCATVNSLVSLDFPINV